METNIENTSVFEIAMNQLDKIALQLTKGWINKNSGVFNQSLKEYKEIKAKIENK